MVMTPNVLAKLPATAAVAGQLDRGVSPHSRAFGALFLPRQ
jgi:hypothetical protein